MSVLSDGQNDMTKIFGSDLKLWLDANQINGIGVAVPNDGDNVSIWKNLGTDYPDFTKQNATRFPVYKKNIDNGNSAVLFTRGSSTTAVDADHLEFTTSFPSITYPYTLITVSKFRILNNNQNGVLCNSALGGIIAISNTYSLDTNGNFISNSFRKNDYLSGITFCIGIRNNVNVAEKIKVANGEYVSQAFSTSRGLPNQVGGRYTDYGSNFQIWNPRNWDGWIFECMVIQGDISLDKDKENKLIAYLKEKYNI